MSATPDKAIRPSTAAAVVAVAVVASVASYEHAYAPVGAHGESGWDAQLVPLTIDDLIYASSLFFWGPQSVAWCCTRWPSGSLCNGSLGVWYSSLLLL
jgi:Protein of unknown function (DUF2637)